ncbi:methylglyoxal reductase (NADPH-dependent) gre2 [Phlyctochytrium planicorne]|nr:methylglyoxal reductase (NADPH-dependent) gre2 [Phlyctochytrium planicorne]
MPELVLVSGVTGYLGAHIALETLKKGFRVRGTVRSEDKGEYLASQVFQDYKGSFEYVIVKDIAVSNAFDDAVKGVDYVIHSASPFHYNVTNVYKDLIDPAVQGTTGILLSVQKFAPGVKRVVVTSSMAAVRSATPKSAEGLTEEDWNDGAVKQLETTGNDTPANVAYAASKTLAEKAAWKFVEEHKPNFDLVVINPPFIFGPPIHHISSYDDINTSVKIISDYAKGLPVKPLVFGYVDVRDVALAHAKALTTPAASNKRIIVSAGTASHYEIARLLKSKFPKTVYDEQVQKEFEENNQGVVEVNRRSKEVLGLEYLGLEKVVVDTVSEVERRFGLN